MTTMEIAYHPGDRVQVGNGITEWTVAAVAGNELVLRSDKQTRRVKADSPKLHPYPEACKVRVLHWPSSGSDAEFWTVGCLHLVCRSDDDGNAVGGMCTDPAEARQIAERHVAYHARKGQPAYIAHIDV